MRPPPLRTFGRQVPVDLLVAKGLASVLQVRTHLDPVIDVCLGDPRLDADFQAGLVATYTEGERLCGWLLEHVHGVARPGSTPNGLEIFRRRDVWVREAAAAVALAAEIDLTPLSVYDEVEAQGGTALAVAFPAGGSVDVFIGDPISIMVQPPTPSFVLAWTAAALDELGDAAYQRAVRLLSIAFDDNGLMEAKNESVEATLERLAALFDVEVRTPLRGAAPFALLRDRLDQPPTTRFFSGQLLDGEGLAAGCAHFTDLALSEFGIEGGDLEALMFRSVGAVLAAGLTSATPDTLRTNRRALEYASKAGLEDLEKLRWSTEDHPAVDSERTAERLSWICITSGVLLLLAADEATESRPSRLHLMGLFSELTHGVVPVIAQKYAIASRLRDPR